MADYYPEGMPRHLDCVDAEVPELLEAVAALYGERVAVADGEETLTYTGLAAAAAALSRDLHEHGIGAGDVVAIHLPNCLDFLVAYFGITGAGATATLVNPLQPPEALERQLETVQAVGVVTHPVTAAPLVPLAARLRRVLLSRGTSCAPEPADRSAADSLLAGGGAALLADVVAAGGQLEGRSRRSPDDVVHFAFTGGTTGAPKAVRVLHRNVVANITQIMAWRMATRVTRGADGRLCLSPIETLPRPYVSPGEDVTVHVPPLFHVHALISSVAFVFGGMTTVLVGRFRPARFVELANRWQATYVTGNPPMFLALAAACSASGETMPSVRLAMSGAAPLNAEQVDRIAAVFPHALIGEGYGLTEVTCVATGTPVVPGSLSRIGSVGLPLPDVDIELRDVDGLTPVEAGAEGEIWIRGPQVADGYHDSPQATAGQFVDGWLRTGDIGVRDEDGFLRIRDRAKDMLIYKGYNVYPRELEGVLTSHPCVSRAAVVGRPSVEAGDLPVAFVVPAEGRKVDPEMLISWVAERVLPYQKVREVHIVEDLPTSAAGKVLKNEVRLLLED